MPHADVTTATDRLWQVAWFAGVAAALALLLRGLFVSAAIVAAICVASHPFGSARERATRRFRREWADRGKDLILVYSDSPHWRGHVEHTWLPRWGQRAVVLNWSERRTWSEHASSEVALFRAYGGSREFNPLAIVVSSSGHVHVVRFWKAFQARKHGKPELLAQAEAKLDDYLRGSESPESCRE
jgi:hypothetical protein